MLSLPHRCLLGAAATLAAATLATGAAHACDPTPRDLGTLGGDNGDVFAVEPSGLAVGTAQDGAGVFRAVTWERGRVRNLDAAADTQGLDANHAGAVVVASRSWPPLSYLWSDGVVRRLQGLPGSGGFAAARRINTRGDIAGYALDAANLLRPVRWVRGRIEDLGTPPGFVDGAALGINDAGVIVGNLGRADGSVAPFRWHKGRYTILATLGGPSGSPFVIDDRGVAAGVADVGPGSGEAVLWDRDGTPHGLGFLRQGDFSQVLGTNGAGDYAGVANVAPQAGGSRGFVVWGGRPMVELPPLSDAVDAVSIAHGLDRRGNAAGASTDAANRRRPTSWRCGRQGVDDML